MFMTSFARACFLYLVLVIGIRLLGKRQIGQMEPSEFVVTMLLANLATIPMEETDLPVYMGLVPIFTVLGLEFLLSVLEMRSVRLRKLLCGKPVILIENGKILQHNLRRTRVTMDELYCHLRQKDVLSPETVQYAILETNGNLSVFPYPEHLPASAREAGINTSPQSLPVTIIADGYLYPENMQVAKVDGAWLEAALKKRKTTVADTWLLTVDGRGKILWVRKD